MNGTNIKKIYEMAEKQAKKLWNKYNCMIPRHLLLVDNGLFNSNLEDLRTYRKAFKYFVELLVMDDGCPCGQDYCTSKEDMWDTIEDIGFIKKQCYQCGYSEKVEQWS